MTYRKLFKLGVLTLVIISLLRWINGSAALPTATELADGAARFPMAVALLAILGLWGLGRTLSRYRNGKGGN